MTPEKSLTSSPRPPESASPSLPPPPDPDLSLGPPVPVKHAILKTLVMGTLCATSALSVAGYLLVSGSFGATRGATRSTQLRWEQRAVEIDAAIASEQAQSQSASPSQSTATLTAEPRHE